MPLCENGKVEQYYPLFDVSSRTGASDKGIFIFMNALVMTEEFWMNSMFSIARFYGGIRVQDKEYILNYQTHDLIRKDFLKTYQKVGRDKVIAMLKEGKSKEEIEEYAKSIKPAPKSTKVKNIEPPRLNFDEE